MGDISIELEAGAHEIRLEFRPTPIARKSNMITLASFGLLGALIAAPFVLKKRRSQP
jgi:hypothetical protein